MDQPRTKQSRRATKQSRRASRLGAIIALVALGSASAIGAAVWSKLYDPKDHYYVRLDESVSGLEVGSGVKMKGVRVGQVRRIDIGRHGVSVIVTLALDPGTPITWDTRATMTAIGVTGLQFIELDGGNARSPRIEPDTRKSIIKAGPSTLDLLMKHGTSIAGKLEALQQSLVGLRSRVAGTRLQGMKDNIQQLVATVERIQRDSRRHTTKITRSLDHVTLAMDRAAGALRAVRGEVNQRGGQARQAALAAARSLERAMNELKLEQVERTLDQTTRAIQRRGAGLNLAHTADVFAAAGRQLARVSDDLDVSLTRSSGQWNEIKKNLREAGLFIQQLKARFIKE